MDHSDHQQRAMSLWCNGDPYDGTGGSWIGHVLPGVIMLLWGTHWATSMFVAHALAWRAARRHSGCGGTLPPAEVDSPAGAQAAGWLASSSWPFVAAHFAASPKTGGGGACRPPFWWLEPALKVALPPIAMVLELWLGHESYHRLMCEPGSQRAGHLYVDHLNNWSHATMYPGFVLSGLIDLAAAFVDLPAGLPNTALGFAFIVDTFVMASHAKHAALDRAVHQLLAIAMTATGAFALAEAAWPRAFMLGFGRCWAILLQGTWFMAVARIMFEGCPAWQDANPPDMAPAMFAPVLFAWHALGVFAGLVLLYAAASALVGGVAWSSGRRGARAAPTFTGVEFSALGPTANKQAAPGSPAYVPALRRTSSCHDHRAMGEDEESGSDDFGDAHVSVVVQGVGGARGAAC